MRAIAHLGLLSVIVSLCVSRTTAQPVIALEGLWEGKCQRGHVVLNANLVMDQQGGRLNGKMISNLTKANFSVQFKEGDKTFNSAFSNNTAVLTAKLLQGGKEATCTLTRKVSSSDRLCIRNIEQTQIFFRLDPGTSNTIRLLPAAETQITGNHTGTLCWDTTDFGTGPCTRSLPQSTYSC
jgi:hypothetical protein